MVRAEDPEHRIQILKCLEVGRGFYPLFFKEKGYIIERGSLEICLPFVTSCQCGPSVKGEK